MKRQRVLNSSSPEPSAPKQQWESGDEDSETEEDKYDNKKEQRDSRGRKKKKLVVTEAPTPAEGATSVGPVLYSPSHFVATETALSPYIDQDLHVYILPEYLNPNNPALKTVDVWGSNPYSIESDPVCILQHSGLYDVLSGGPPAEDLVALNLILRIHRGIPELPGSERGGIVSKDGNAPGAAVCLSALQFSLLKDGTSLDLVQSLRKAPPSGPARPERPLAASAPPMVPVESAQSGASKDLANGLKRGPSRRHKRAAEEVDSRVAIDVLPDTILQFNLSNELAFQYNLNLICDRGIEPSQWTSHRLRNAVLMVETLQERYELSWEQDSHPSTTSNAHYDTYRFSQVFRPIAKTRAWHTSHTVPLSSEHAKPIHTGLDWSQFVWGPSSLTIEKEVYPIRRVFWIARTSSSSSNGATSSSPSSSMTNPTS